jgi:hypothetical protein
MKPSRLEERIAEHKRTRTIVETLSRIADEARERDREAYAEATARRVAAAKALASGDALPRVA